MTSSDGVFGPANQFSTTDRALTSIAKSPTPDVNTDFVRMIAEHDAQIKYLAQSQQKLQQGVDQANQGIIQEIQQFISDVAVLFSGGATPKGAYDLGDLQYILPAWGALMGYGADGDKPLNLYAAAEKFFFGYVVPNQQWSDLIDAKIQSWWGDTLGLDPKFVKDLVHLNDEISAMWGSIDNLFASIKSFFNEMTGVTDGDLGWLGQLLNPIIKFFTGIDLTKFGDAADMTTTMLDPWVNQLTSWVDTITAWFNGMAVNPQDLPSVELTGNLLKGLTTFTNDIFGGGIDFSDPGSWDQVWPDVVKNIIDPLNAFLKPGSWINTNTLWGQLDSSLFGIVPKSAISDTDASPLFNPDFQGAISISEGGGWSWDPDVYYTNVDDANDVGSAHCVADGTLHGLRSNAFAVQSSQQVPIDVHVLVGAFGGVGTPIRAEILPFKTFPSGGTEQVGAPVLMAQCGNATDDPVHWIGAPAGSHEIKLLGTYTVPSDGSVNQLRIRLVVDAGMTGGDVWFDNVSTTLGGGLLADLLNDKDVKTAAFKTFLSSVFTAFVTDVTSLSFFQLMTDLNTAWQTYVTTVSDLAEDEFATLGQIVNSLLGLDPNTGMTPPTRVQGWAGMQDLNTTFGQMIAQIGAALEGDVADAGEGWAWLAQLMNLLGVKADHAQTLGITNADILNIQNNRPLNAGLEATVEANMTLESLTANSYVSVSDPNNSFYGYGSMVRMSQAKTIGFIQWIGALKNTKNGSEQLQIWAYKLNQATGGLDPLLRVNPPASALTAGDPIWMVYQLPGAGRFEVVAGDVICVFFALTSSNNPAFNQYNMVGVPTALSANGHPTADVSHPGIVNNAPYQGAPPLTGIAAADIQWSGAYPYVGLGVSDLPANYHPPQPLSYAPIYSGNWIYSFTVPVPSWANFVDRIAVGGGGGGAGGINGPGSPGGDTTITAGTNTLTANGGAGGPGGNTSTEPWSHGLSPGNETFLNAIYIGGAEVAAIQQGSVPGGGGGGGEAFWTQFGYGGRAGSWAADTVTLDGSITEITITVGAGGDPNMTPGNNPQPSYGCKPGGNGKAWLVFRQV